MKFDNSKRMQLVASTFLQKGKKSQSNSNAFILEEAPAPPQRGGRGDEVIDSMSSMTTLVQGKPVSSGIDGAVVSSIKVYKQLPSVASSELSSATSDSCASYDSRVTLTFHHKQIISVQKSWEQVKDIEALAENVLLQMFRVQPSSRQDLGLQSMRVARFDEVASLLKRSLEAVIQDLLCPDVEVADLADLAREYKQNGVSAKLVAQALPEGVHTTFPLSETQKKAWTDVMGPVFQAIGGDV